MDLLKKLSGINHNSYNQVPESKSTNKGNFNNLTVTQNPTPSTAQTKDNTPTTDLGTDLRKRRTQSNGASTYINKPSCSYSPVQQEEGAEKIKAVLKSDAVKLTEDNDITKLKNDISALKYAEISDFLDALEKNKTMLPSVFSSLNNEVFLSLLEVFENKISNIVLTKKQSESTCYLCGLMIEHLVNYNQSVSSKLYGILIHIAKEQGDLISDDLEKCFNNNKKYLEHCFQQGNSKYKITDNFLNLLEKLVQYNRKHTSTILLIERIIPAIVKLTQDNDQNCLFFSEYLCRISSHLYEATSPEYFLFELIKKPKIPSNLLNFLIINMENFNLRQCNDFSEEAKQQIRINMNLIEAHQNSGGIFYQLSESEGIAESEV